MAKGSASVALGGDGKENDKKKDGNFGELKPYTPVVQTYIRNNSDDPVGGALAHPPVEYEGIRYAIAQGPSAACQSTIDNVIAVSVAFNASTLQKACRLAAEYNAQLITFPELFMTGYEFGEGKGTPEELKFSTENAHAAADYLRRQGIMDGLPEDGGEVNPAMPFQYLVAKAAKDNNITIVCPYPLSGTDPSGKEGYFDVAAIYNNKGHLVGHQFKTQLWGTAERTWFNVAHFPKDISPDNDYQNDTNAFRSWDVNGVPIGICICFDIEFPEVARNLALNGSLITVVPTAAPEGMLPGQTEPYPDIAEHYIPANALMNFNFCTYSNRADWEYVPGQGGDEKGNKDLKALQYTGNSIVCSPYGKSLVAAVANEDCLLICDCIPCDFPPTQPKETNYLINRRPDIWGVLTQETVPFPYGKSYTYKPDLGVGEVPKQPEKGQNECPEWTPEEGTTPEPK